RSQAPGGGAVTELVLARSGVSGEPVQFCTGRAYLARALRLGFREFHLAGAGGAALCRDGSRIYVWMGLRAAPTPSGRGAPGGAPPGRAGGRRLAGGPAPRRVPSRTPRRTRCAQENARPPRPRLPSLLRDPSGTSPPGR